MFVCLCIVCGSFLRTVEELSSKPTLDLYRRGLLSPVLNHNLSARALCLFIRQIFSLPGPSYLVPKIEAMVLKLQFLVLFLVFFFTFSFLYAVEHIFQTKCACENPLWKTQKSAISLVEAEFCLAGLPLIFVTITLWDALLTYQGPGDCEKSYPPPRYFQGQTPVWHPAVVWSCGKL